MKKTLKNNTVQIEQTNTTGVTKLQRIWYLFRLQMSEKFKNTTSIRGILYGTVFKIIAIAIVAFVIYFLLKYFNGQGYLNLDEDVLSVFICFQDGLSHGIYGGMVGGHCFIRGFVMCHLVRFLWLSPCWG